MTDEIERLNEAFRKQDGVRPAGRAKRVAVETAMERFSEEFLSVSQGTGMQDRQKEEGNNRKTSYFWRSLMNTLNSRLTYSLAGGASIAVLAFALVNLNIIETGLQDRIKPGTSTRPTTSEAQKEQRRTRDDAAVESEQEAFSDASGRERQQAEPKSEDLSATAPQPGNLVQELVSPAPSPMMKSLGEQRSAMPVQRKLTGPSSPDRAVPQYRDQGRDTFSKITPNPVKVTREEPVSTFSVDVDTASYAFMRSSLNNNVLPQKDSVRVEEFINYFDYGYETPAERSEPFKPTVSIMPTPWNDKTKLLSIGIKGYQLQKQEKPAANLVFLIDTSGSMNAPDKLPLLRNSFKLLLDTLGADDTVSIVTYAGSAGTVLEPTKVREKGKILAALDNLHAGGSTAGAEGIRQAYLLAERNKLAEGVNRVILATDGDFNVGISNPEELKGYVERKRQTGISLSVLGFGRGNYNDALMQVLAQNGNGNAAYIDTLGEARKVLVEEAGSTLFTIAKDVKLQVEFNPALVGEYRLIGYETRLLNREDFNNDKVDAGEIGAGHSVTALYELTPPNSGARLVEDLRYGENKVEFSGDASEYGFLKIRYKLPGSDTSSLVSVPITKAEESVSVSSAPEASRFAAAVAAYGQILRGGQYTGAFSHDDVIGLAQGAKGADPFGYRAEFINLVRLAKGAAALETLEQ